MTGEDTAKLIAMETIARCLERLTLIAEWEALTKKRLEHGREDCPNWLFRRKAAIEKELGWG